MTLKQALQLLEEKKYDVFMEAVSGLISPKPWRHGHNVDDLCPRCGAEICDRGQVMEAWHQPCSIPPKLTDPPEVIAFRLRDQANEKGCHRDAVFIIAHKIDGKILSHSSADYWFAYDATPQEQIACCLQALGLWEEEK